MPELGRGQEVSHITDAGVRGVVGGESHCPCRGWGVGDKSHTDTGAWEGHVKYPQKKLLGTRFGQRQKALEAFVWANHVQFSHGHATFAPWQHFLFGVFRSSALMVFAGI